METSAYLSAIQSLEGDTPGAKYKTLHSIATKIIENSSGKDEFLRTGKSERVNSVLLPHVRILVGIKLQSSDAVIEALKSDDVTIIKLALNAKWFFNASNQLLNAENFVRNIVPHIALRTRLELVKTLANCLKNQPGKADEFFDKFCEQYGYDQAMPLIAACSEDHIYDQILKRKLQIPQRILTTLYRRYPELVIRYLQLGNNKNEKNAADRKMYSFDLKDYYKFLPILVKNHTRVFVELFELLEYRHSVELGSTRAEFFLKNALDVVVEKPKIFLDILPFKLVYNKLSTQQFEQMFENLMEKDADAHRCSCLLNYLQYYPQEKKFELLQKKLKKVCDKDVLELEGILDYDSLCKIIPANLRAECTKKRLSKLNSKDADYWLEIGNLPPKEAIPLLKERIAKVSGTSRAECLTRMILSCSHYDSKEDLLELLEYYNTRHKNEQAPVLLDFLGTLERSFKLEELEKRHWVIIREIVQRAYVKGDLFLSTYLFSPSSFFESAIKYYLKQCKADPQDEDARTFLNKLIDMVLEFYFERNTQWRFVVDSKELERDCLERFLIAIPKKYPETSSSWSKKKIKLDLTTYLIETMNDINEKYYTVSGKRRQSQSNNTLDSESKNAKLSIRNHGWLAKLALDLVKAGNNVSSYREKQDFINLRRLLRKHDREYYKNLIDSNPDLLYDISSGDALVILKHEFGKILNSWEEYLKACRAKLQKNDKATRSFVALTKWYKDIPMKFVERCLAEIEEKGSITILGILLEGEALSRVIEPYLPKDSKVDFEDEEAKKKYEITASLPVAINRANPPVSLETLTPFFTNDYLSLATKCINCVARRVPIDRVIKFADQLMDKSTSVRKLGIRLMIMVASSNERREILQHKWATEKNSGIREVLAKMVYELFIHSPSDDTWQLMKIFIDGLTADDKTSVETFVKVKPIRKKYSADYIQRILKKIQDFDEEDFSEQDKSALISGLVNDIDQGMIDDLPEDALTDIVKKYFFGCSMDFLILNYLLSNDEKYQQRLDIIHETIREAFTKSHVLHPKHSRYYPVAHQIEKFFEELIDTLLKNEDAGVNLKFINSFLTKPWFSKEVRSYIRLHIYRIYFEENDAKKIGVKYVDNANVLIKEYGSDVIIHDYAELLKEFLRNQKVFEDVKNQDLTMTVIEGMMSKDLRLSALIGIEMLNRYQVDTYDSRYEDFIAKWLAIDNVMTRYAVNNFLASIDKSFC